MRTLLPLVCTGCIYLSSAERDARWDLDKDGVERPFDCDDTDPAVSPLALERCDDRNLDEDCDGRSDDVDEAAEGRITYCLDSDGDGIGDAATAIERCDPPSSPGAWVTRCGGQTEPPIGTPGDCEGLPKASLSLTPAAGERAVSVFLADASGSQGDDLRYRFSWGSAPSGELSETNSAERVLEESGWIEVTLEVVDRCDRSAFAVGHIAVSEPGELIEVTSSAARGSGSFEEAILLANDRSGPQVITFAPGIAPVQTTSDLPALDDDGGILVGPGVVLDGSGGGLLSMKGQGAIVSGLILDGFIEPNNGALQLHGPLSQAYGVTVQNSDVGIEIDGEDAAIYGGRVSGSADNQLNLRARASVTGLVVEGGLSHGISIKKASGSRLSLCQIYGNSKDAINISGNVDAIEILDSTIVSNLGDGIDIQSQPAGGLTLRNTVLAYNGDYGLHGSDDNLLSGGLSHVLWFSNGRGDCSDCSSFGAAYLSTDPMLEDLSGGDLRPREGSPLIDAGTPETGSDRNGAAPGSYFGQAPDIGALESEPASTREGSGG